MRLTRNQKQLLAAMWNGKLAVDKRQCWLVPSMQKISLKTARSLVKKGLIEEIGMSLFPASLTFKGRVEAHAIVSRRKRNG